MNLNLLSLNGMRAQAYLEDLAQLRIRVFYDWPYLYEGTLEYEKKYLETYFKSDFSFVALAIDDDKVVGASTAIWLPHAEEDFKKPFVENHFDLNSVCYFGESVLLENYRGLGLGRKLMDARLKFAKSLPRVKTCAFCAVVRPDNHPLKPDAYRPLDTFWNSCGFEKKKNMITDFSWLDREQTKETKKPMQFWLKQMEEKT